MQESKTNGKSLKRLEARGGIEPPNKGFADLSLTTWVPRPLLAQNSSTLRHCNGLGLAASTSDGLGRVEQKILPISSAISVVFGDGRRSCTESVFSSKKSAPFSFFVVLTRKCLKAIPHEEHLKPIAL